MRTVGFLLAVVTASLLTVQDARAQQGTTNCTIGAVTFNPAVNATSASSGITMSLDATTKGFTGLQVVVTDTSLIGGGPVPVTIGPYNAPTPGGAPVTAPISWSVKSGRSYKIEATMKYIDKNNAAVFFPATPTTVKAP